MTLTLTLTLTLALTVIAGRRTCRSALLTVLKAATLPLPPATTLALTTASTLTLSVALCEGRGQRRVERCRTDGSGLRRGGGVP